MLKSYPLQADPTCRKDTLLKLFLSNYSWEAAAAVDEKFLELLLAAAFKLRTTSFSMARLDIFFALGYILKKKILVFLHNYHSFKVYYSLVKRKKEFCFLF